MSKIDNLSNDMEPMSFYFSLTQTMQQASQRGLKNIGKTQSCNDFV